MGLFTYLSEEIYKIVSNFRKIVISFFITVCLYSGISYILYRYWDKLLNYDDDKFYFRFYIPQLWHLFWIIIIHLGLNIIYENKFEFLERYRYVESWPWEKNPYEWEKLYGKTFWIYLLNQCVVYPLLMFFFSYLGEQHDISKENFPGFFEVCWQIIVFDLINDVLLFVVHRIFHTQFFYEYFHKLHHEYIDVVGISGEYYHPVEFFLINSAFLVGPKLLGARTHMLTFILWQFTRTYDNIVQNYSGYNFPWRPLGICPFQNGPSYHYFHQETQRGNYTFNYNILDRFFGYDQEYLEMVHDNKIKNKYD